jgi:hypothetical protein
MSQVFKEIPVSDLKLDLFNPRLPKSKQGKDEKTVIEYMLLEAATTELMTAIAENDFFAGELLLVIEDDLDTGKYVVVEGNRRLTAVKLLQNANLTSVKKTAVNEIIESAKHKPLNLPCLVFEDKNKILKYLGFRHITGIKSWRLLEKARYLSELRERDFANTSFLLASSEIAKMIGSNSAYVKRLLISFDLYKIIEDEAFYQIDGLNDMKFFLNYFTDSLIKENIRKFINIDLNNELPLENLNSDNLKEVVSWWFEKFEGQSRVIGDSEGLKHLDKVVGHTLALDAFRKGLPIKDAYEMTGDIDIQFEKKIKESLKSIEQADVMSNKVSSFYSDLSEDLKTIRKVALKINDYKTNLEQDGDEF